MRPRGDAPPRRALELVADVDAYETNIDGFGYRFDPVIDFESEDAREKVRDTLMLERLAAREGRHSGAGHRRRAHSGRGQQAKR